MSLTNFTVEHDFYAYQTDLDGSGDADLVPLSGSAIFTPIFGDDRAVLAPDHMPESAGFKLLPIAGYLDSGRLKDAPSGNVGVRLPANDPVMELEQLVYRVDFRVATTSGERLRVAAGYFEAPSSDVTIHLADVLQPTGVFSKSFVKIAPGAVRLEDNSLIFSFGGVDIADPLDADELEPTITSDQISDASAASRNLIKASSAAAARSAIGAEAAVAKGQPNGYAPLNSIGQIDAGLLPAIFADADGGASISFALFL